MPVASPAAFFREVGRSDLELKFLEGSSPKAFKGDLVLGGRRQQDFP